MTQGLNNWRPIKVTSEPEDPVAVAALMASGLTQKDAEQKAFEDRMFYGTNPTYPIVMENDEKRIIIHQAKTTLEMKTP